MKQFWLDKYFDNQNKCYNIYPDAKGLTKGIKRSEEEKRKIRNSRKNKKVKRKTNGVIIYEYLKTLTKGIYKKKDICKQLKLAKQLNINKYLKYQKIIDLVNEGYIIIHHHTIEILKEIDQSFEEKYKFKKQKMNIENNFYVYKFIDKENNVLYIGKTNNLKNRMEEHFGSTGHLDNQCYNSTDKILYIELNNEDEMSIYERYLINKISPIYNKKHNNNSKFSFELPELEWKECLID